MNWLHKKLGIWKKFNSIQFPFFIFCDIKSLMAVFQSHVECSEHLALPAFKLETQQSWFRLQRETLFFSVLDTTSKKCFGLSSNQVRYWIRFPKNGYFPFFTDRKVNPQTLLEERVVGHAGCILMPLFWALRPHFPPCWKCWYGSI